MLNNAASTGNNQWIKDYWTWAVQYYEFKSNKVIEGKYNPEMKKFLLYNVMLGAVLSFNKRYECLSHIMKYSNATNRYPLIPGTFRDIVDIASQIDAMRGLVSDNVSLMKKNTENVIQSLKGIKTTSKSKLSKTPYYQREYINLMR